MKSFALAALVATVAAEAGYTCTVADGVPWDGGHHPQHLPHLLRGVHNELHSASNRQELDKWRNMGKQGWSQRIESGHWTEIIHSNLMMFYALKFDK